MTPLSQTVDSSSVVPPTPEAPAESPPTPQETAVERALNYKEMSKADLNAEYDRLRADSPDTAAAEGMKMHLAYW